LNCPGTYLPSSNSFRFIILDQDPAGKTVILGSSALTLERNGMGNGAPEKENGGLNVFKKCLHKHLERIRDLGPTYEKFVTQHFDEALIQTLAYKAAESINLPDADRDEQTLTFAKSPVLYNLCALPLEMDQAADWFNKKYEGYTKYLGHFFDSDYFKEHDFSVLCVIVYGRTEEAWISVTIVPIGKGPGDKSEEMEIMSYEFLSEDEKRSLALNYDEIGRIV